MAVDFDTPVTNPSDSVDFVATARKRFAAAAEDERHLRDKFASDLRFASPDGDDQWDPLVKMQREQAGRPAMSFPRCHTFVQQVSNEARQNKPEIKFAPRLDADTETAKIFEGLARFIQYSSDAQVAYETAIEYSAGASFGYYRFLTDYADDESDDLELKVVPVLDPMAVYGVVVPACFNREPRYAFVVEDVPKEDFKAEYPDAEMSSMGWDAAESRADGWVGSESVRVAEYWWIEEGKKEKGKRKAKSKVKFCKINGLEILPGTETDWPGSTIPIVPVLGKQMIIDGKPRLFSVVRPQKAAQQLINYSKSRIAETLATSPISPFMVAEGQISGYEKEWESLNTRVKPFLTYKMVDTAGRPVPAPQRQTFEPPIQALSAFVLQEVDDMKATTGIFDASLGQQSNETSGQAIQRRQQQSAQSNMHFMDNLERSFRKGGDIIKELIPLVYDTARTIQILGEDEAPQVIQINQAHVDKKGKPQHFDLTSGKFDIVVTMGKSFSSKRMEAFDTMQQVLATNPGLMNMIGDIFFKNSNMAGADQLADRFKKMLPPNLQAGDDDQMPPQAQQAIQQLQQQLQQVHAAAQVYEGQIQQLQFEKKAELVKNQGRLDELDKQLAVKMAIAEIETKAQDSSERQEFVREVVLQVLGQQHDQTMQASQQQAQQQQAQQQAQSQSSLSAQNAQQGQQAQMMAQQPDQSPAPGQ